MGEREFIYNQCLPLSGTLLEIGTGKGHFALTLGRHGHRFTSIDVNAVDQNIARMNLSYYGWEGAADLRLADAERLPFPDKSVDAVLSVNVVHHLERPDIVGGEMVRVLKETGKIILADFTGEGMALVNRCHTLEGKSHDAYRRKMDEFRSFFDAHGFRHETRQSRHQEVLIISRRTTP
jgi:ubiquinone/menaquinone biosynthesis C-methylase UbiE